MPDGPSRFQIPASVRRLSGAGLELAGFALILGGLGYLVDRQIGWRQPYLAIAGVLIGFGLGMYRLIRIANSLNRDD